MNQREDRGFGIDDLLNLEGQLQGGWKKQEAPKQELPPPPQQPPQQESYTTPKLSPEEQELADKLKEVEGLPRRTKEERTIRVKRVEEILKLSQREFARLYQVCYLGSKDEHPDGHHIAVQRGKEARVSPEIIPIGLAEDILGDDLLPCYYHYVGFITGAIARNKPYEVLPFNPSQDLQQIIESATQDYKLVSRQNPQRNYKLKPEEDLVTAVIFEDAAYADPSKRQEVVGYLQRAVQSFKEGQITRDELAAIVRNKGKTAPAQERVAAEPIPKEGEKPLEEILTYGFPYSLNPANIEHINSALAAYMKIVPRAVMPDEVVLLGQSSLATLRFNRKELSDEELNNSYNYVKWLNTVIEGIREGKQDYELLYALAEDRVGYINSLINTFNQRYELHRNVPEGEKAKVHFYENELIRKDEKDVLQSLLKVQEVAIRVQKLDIIVGMLKKDPSRVKEAMPEIYQAFGQQQQ